MRNRKVICIVCPLGCEVEIVSKEDDFIIKGNKCIRGKRYAIKEITNPTRIVTSTVKINNRSFKRLPVRTDKAIPKSKIFQCMAIINSLELETPIRINEVIIENIVGTDSNLISSRSVKW